jgi:hypothetical protein
MEEVNKEYPVTTGYMKYYRPTMGELMSEANKYIALGNIVDSVKEYKENETPLDIQLREFKKSQQNNEQI